MPPTGKSTAPSAPEASSRGSVLILALWALMFLAALAIAVGAHVAAGMRLAVELREATVDAAAARAGVAAALDILRDDTNAWDALTEAWADAPARLSEAAVGAARFSVYSVVATTAGAVTNAGMVDEERKVSLNQADEALLAALFHTAGQLGEQKSLALARATVAWRGGRDDELTSTAGAAYDAGSEKRYAGGHGLFARVAEWRLVKGVDDNLYRAVAPHLTVWGSGRVNLNTAGRVVLEALVGRLGGESADGRALIGKIERFRKAGRAFESASGPDLTRRLNEFEGLTSAEVTLLRTMARSAQCRSWFYGAVVAARAHAAAPSRVCAEFVVDKQKGQRVYWYEY